MRQSIRSPFAWISLVIGGVILAALLAFLFGLIVMALWNWLMPGIFGIRAISYWEAWGLVLLAHILFKAGRWDHRSSHRERPRDEEWKERFRRRFKDRFFGSAAEGSAGPGGPTGPEPFQQAPPEEPSGGESQGPR